MIDTIYSDFDGTVTKTDTVNTFFEMYADERWKESEAEWVAGKITSKKNAIIQVGMIRPMTQKTLDDFIDSIEIDDGFIEFCEFLKEHNIKLNILSDGFDLFIEKTLEKYKLRNIKFFANHLIYENNKFRIEFPFHNTKCDIGAGMCKCAQIKTPKYMYIGDGVSDLCVAKKAEILFASKYLDSYCNKNNIKHVSFTTFSDILGYVEANFKD